MRTKASPNECAGHFNPGLLSTWDPSLNRPINFKMCLGQCKDNCTGLGEHADFN